MEKKLVSCLKNNRSFLFFDRCSSASPAGNAGAVLKRERRNQLEDIATGLHQTYSSVHIQ